MNILQRVTVMFEVTHHILLWAHHRVTTPVSVYRPRVRPKGCAPASEKQMSGEVAQVGTNVKRREKSRQREEKDNENDIVRTWDGFDLGSEQGTE
jgi:hypothetical protein